MELRYKRLSFRPNTDVEFWNFTPEQLEIIKSKYDDTGKRISFTVTTSDDGLDQTWEHVWSSIESWQEYNTEFAESWKERDAYNEANTIVSIKV